MALANAHCPEDLPECHGHLCAGQVHKENGWTVFHALACLGIDDAETIHLAVEVSRWTESKSLMLIALQEDKQGMLPSALAASKQNLPLCVSLARIEDRFRTGSSEEIPQSKIDALQIRRAKVSKKRAAGLGGQRRIPSSMMIKSANRGCSYGVRNLVDFSIQPCDQGKTCRETVLHLLASRGNVSMIGFLVDHGAEVDAKDEDLRTPLHQAAPHGWQDAARELLKRGADVDAQDGKGRTPLYLAVVQGHADVVQLLVSAGADQSIRGGHMHRTPWQVAQSLDRSDIAKMLDI